MPGTIGKVQRGTNLSLQQAEYIINFIQQRFSWNTPISDISRMLQNHVQYRHDPASLPKDIQEREADLASGWHKYSTVHLVQMQDFGSCSPHDMRQAVYLYGRSFMELLCLDGSMHRHPATDPRYFQYGCFLLDLAVDLGYVPAAILLVKAVSEQMTMPGYQDAVVNEAPSKNLIVQAVEKSAGYLDWATLSIYMTLRYDKISLNKHSSAELLWAMQALLREAEKLRRGYPIERQFYFDQTGNPYTVLLRLVQYCLRRPDFRGLPTDDLRHWYDLALTGAATFNDPEASFTLAIRDEEFGTHMWVNRMTAAGAGGHATACWLLAIYYWRKDGVYPVKIQDQPTQSFFNAAPIPTRSQGFNWAALSIYATVAGDATSLEANKNFVDWALTLAAVQRWLERKDEEGGTLLMELCDYAKDVNVLPVTKKRLNTHTEEYLDGRIGEWTDEKCRRIVEEGTNAERMIETERRKFG